MGEKKCYVVITTCRDDWSQHNHWFEGDVIGVYIDRQQAEIAAREHDWAQTCQVFETVLHEGFGL